MCQVQRLARITTALIPSNEEDKSIQPDVVPVDFDFDNDVYLNALKNNKVAIVIDNLNR
jgi:hypothetical protein